VNYKLDGSIIRYENSFVISIGFMSNIIPYPLGWTQVGTSRLSLKSQEWIVTNSTPKAGRASTLGTKLMGYSKTIQLKFIKRNRGRQPNMESILI
jgi:hypothetical protein